jgi:hypothetical protein
MATTAAPHINSSNYPLKDIPQPHDHDVLCGRGGGTNNHIGNSHWRMLVAANKQLYMTLPKRQKMLLSRSIVNAVRSQNPPGRFLQKDGKSDLWSDVGDQRAQEKTSQALREGAPDIRKKVSSQEETDKDGAAEFGANAMGEENVLAESSDEEGESLQKPLDVRNFKEPQTSQKQPSQEAASIPPGGATKVSASSSSCISSNAASIRPPQTASGRPVSEGMAQNNASGFHSATSEGSYGSLAQFISPTSSQQQAMMAQFAAQHMNSSNSSGGVNMRLYPTMVLNDQGMLVPGMSVLPHPSMAMSQLFPQMSTAGSTITQANSAQQQQHIQRHMQQLYQQQRRQPGMDNNDFEPLPVSHVSQLQQDNSCSAFGVEDSSGSYNVNGNYSSQHYQDMMNRNNKDSMIPTFDEFVAAPNALDPAGRSFGSMTMTDSERSQQQAPPIYMDSSSFHNRQTAKIASLPNSNLYMNHNYQRQQLHRHGNEIEGAVPGGLELTGVSFGDISMMSSGTNNMKLEDTGISFGTVMSYSMMNPTAVDGGLGAIGTSFGSLSLDTSNQDTLFRALELAAEGPEIPPMFPSEEKAHGNLLDCSDTDSENSEDQEKLVKQKSQAWERMKSQIATETNLMPDSSRGSVASRNLMPPPLDAPKSQRLPPMSHHSASSAHQSTMEVFFVKTELEVPTTALENNFSTLSAWSAAEDFVNDDIGGNAHAAGGAPRPPQAPRKDDSW